LLNWLVFIPLMLSILTLPHIFVALISWRHNFGRPNWNILFLGAIFAIFASCYVGFSLPSSVKDLNKISFRKSTQHEFLLFCLLPLGISSILFSVWWAWPVDFSSLPPNFLPRNYN